MKRLFICIIVMLCLGVNNSSSQDFVRSGNVFKSVKSKTNKSKAPKDTVITQFRFEVGGVEYPIIMNKGTGSCYIWKRKVKSPNEKYRMYMKSEVSAQIAEAFGIKYIPKSGKK